MRMIRKVSFSRAKHMQHGILMSNSYYLYRFFKECKEDGMLDPDQWNINTFSNWYKEEMMEMVDKHENMSSEYSCIAAMSFVDANDVGNTPYCDFCPFDTIVCGPSNISLFSQYYKMMNWDFPKIFEKKKIPSYDTFRTLGLVRHFTEICLKHAFATPHISAYKYYNID